MNWEAIGAIGEIGGFIVVLVTLLFLYAQVRQIVTQNKAAAMDASTRSGQLMQMQVATQPELAELLLQARTDPQSLAPEKLVQLRAYVGYQVLNWQSMFLQMELGNLSSADWEATKPMIRASGQHQVNRKLMLEVSSFFNPRFFAALKEILAED